MLNLKDSVLIFKDDDADMTAKVSTSTGHVAFEYDTPNGAVIVKQHSFILELSRGEFLDFAQAIEELAKQVRKNTVMPEAVE